MTVSASDVAVELRRRLPGLPTTKLHKLLYYCQGHHLAATGVILFGDSIMAFDRGPVVSRLWKQEQAAGPVDGPPVTDEAALNTIGYVVSRYGRLTGRDLINLTHAETPWRRADAERAPGTSVRIELDWMRDYFVADADEAGPDDIALDGPEVTRWLAGAAGRREAPASWDSVDELRRRAGAS